MDTRFTEVKTDSPNYYKPSTVVKTGSPKFYKLATRLALVKTEICI